MSLDDECGTGEAGSSAAGVLASGPGLLRGALARFGLLAVLVTSVTTAPASPPTGGGVARELADIGPAPDVSLTDQAGRPFAMGSRRGKAVLVSFIYTTCNGSCPATTHRLGRAQDALKAAGLWGDRVEFVSISLDPSRDTPEVLANYARVYDADPDHWHFLTGPPVDVARVVTAWGMWARVGPGGTLDHPSRIFLVDPSGRQREIYNLDFLKPETVVRDVKTVLREERTERAPRGRPSGRDTRPSLRAPEMPPVLGPES